MIGELSIKPESEIIIADDNNIIPTIIVMPKENLNKEVYEEKLKPYNMGIILLKDKAVLKANILKDLEDIPYSSIFTLDIKNKAELLNVMSFKNLLPTYLLFFITVLIYLYVVYFISNIIDAAVLGIIGFLFARIIKIKLNYKASFNIGAHALTLPIILNLIYIIINTFTGFEINYFGLMYTSISYIYIAVSILILKADIINKQMQLIRH